MAAARRQILRPTLAPPATPQHQRQIQKLRHRLTQERSAFERWMARLKRAFHAVEKHQHQAIRLQRRIARLEET
ncbi:MAG TPA: hypothetical protein VKE94_22780 [Gemmataceae bacterium]|nr:hypothetical protein [Gemmataceae bacterium]